MPDLNPYRQTPQEDEAEPLRGDAVSRWSRRALVFAIAWPVGSFLLIWGAGKVGWYHNDRDEFIILTWPFAVIVGLSTAIGLFVVKMGEVFLSARPLLKRAAVLAVLVGSTFGGGTIALSIVRDFIAMPYRARRAEVLVNVDDIRNAELAYFAAFDTYIPVPDPTPMAVERLGKAQVSWIAGSAFDTLGWTPDGHVRGTYWVSTSPDGTDFVVHGLCDVDGDGDLAHYTATKSIEAVFISGDDRFY